MTPHETAVVPPSPLAWIARAFCGAWILYAVLVLSFPGRSVAGSAVGGASLMLAFASLVLVGMRVLRPRHPGAHPGAGDGEDLGDIGRLAWLGLGLGLLGLGCLAFDRIVVQGIDVGAGLAAARETWAKAGAARNGPSSAFSVIGYAFGGCHFAAASLVLIRVNAVPTARQAGFLVGCAAVVLASSSLNGGRSSLLLFPAVCAATGAINPRLSLGRTVRRPWALATAAVGVIYSVTVFESRISASELDARRYSLDFLTYLRLEPSAWLRSWAIPDVAWLFVLAWAYLAHSFSIACEIALRPVSDHVVVGSHVLSMLAKLGVGSRPDSAWFLSGRLPSLPGAMFHQAGALGLAVGSIVLGGGTALAVRAVGRWPGSIAAIGACSGCVAVLLLSPFLSALDLLEFPSAILGYLILGVAGRLLPADRAAQADSRQVDLR